MWAESLELGWDHTVGLDELFVPIKACLLCSKLYSLPSLQKCNGLHIVEVPAAWLTSSQAVWESGAASRLFTATVMTECTTQTASVCVYVCGDLFFFSAHLYAACVFIPLVWVSQCFNPCKLVLSMRGLCASLRNEFELSFFACLSCLNVWMYVCFYSCVYTPVCESGTLKVRIVWEGFKRDACHSLNAPPPSS